MRVTSSIISAMTKCAVFCVYATPIWRRQPNSQILPKLTGNNRLVALRVFSDSPRRLIAVIVFFLALYPSIGSAGTSLIMVTSDYCPFCKAWENDVGTVYDKSPYAQTLPLTRINIGRPIPEGVVLQEPVVGTPTFLIIRDSQEIGRQHGYDDKEMFWWWLSEHAAK